MTLPPPVTPTIDFDAPGASHHFLRLPYSRDDSAWGSVMIPVAVLGSAPARPRRRRRRNAAQALAGGTRRSI